MKATDSGAGRDMDDFDDVRRLYRQEAVGIEPPARLDDAILAASRRAVQAGPVPAGVGRSGWRWQAPLAAAAVVVLATSLAVLFFEDDGRLPERDLPPVSRAPAPETPPSRGDGVTAPGEGLMRQAQVPERTAGRNSERAAEAPPRPRIVEERMGPPVATEAVTPDLAGNTSAGTPGAVPVPATVPTPALSDSVAAKVGSSNRRDEDPARIRRGEAEPVASQQRSVRAPVSSAEESSAGAAPAGRAAPGAAVARREADARTGPAATEAAAPPPSFVDGLAPQRRLEEIRRLWDSGRREEASRRFEAFLHDHPGFAIPPDFPVTRPPPR